MIWTHAHHSEHQSVLRTLLTLASFKLFEHQDGRCCGEEAAFQSRPPFSYTNVQSSLDLAKSVVTSKNLTESKV